MASTVKRLVTFENSEVLNTAGDNSKRKNKVLVANEKTLVIPYKVKIKLFTNFVAVLESRFL